MKFVDLNYCSETATTITASSQDVSFPSSNLANPLRSKVWRSTGCVSESVTFDFATIVPIDSIVLLWSKENGPKLSSGATITVQANATNVWTSPAYSQVATINNTYSEVSVYPATSQSYRYWRILIADPSNPYGYVELGVAFIGQSIQIQNAQNGFRYVLTDLSVAQATPFGHSYVDVYPQQASLSFSYANMDYASVQTIENSFRNRGTVKPVLVVLDPSGAVFNRDHLCVYGKFSTPFGSTQINYNLLTTDNIAIVELS